MARWRIHRLKINGFKVFTQFSENYSSDLVIYDGPNGFGKTSLFDAKQLLFCSELPRISARHRALKSGNNNKKYNRSIFQNHNCHDGISIIAELQKGNEILYVMRMAKQEDLDSSVNRPNSFNEFKLYELSGFDETASPRLIDDEKQFWSEKFGDKFLENFPVLNYLQQDSKSIVIPDGCNSDKRTDQISHLLNLDELDTRIDNIGKLKSESKAQLKYAEDEYAKQKLRLEDLQHTLTVSDVAPVAYIKLTESKVTPQWDLKVPFSVDSLKSLEQLLGQLDLLNNVYVGRQEIAKRVRNQLKIDFTKRAEFGLAVRLFHHFDKLPALHKDKAALDRLDKICHALDIEVSKLTSSHGSLISSYIEEQESIKLMRLIEDKNKLHLGHSGVSKKQAAVMQLRTKLLQIVDNIENDCPLCGFDYQENSILLSAIEAKTALLDQKLTKIGLQINQCYQAIEAILVPLKAKYAPLLETVRREFNVKLYSELAEYEHQMQRLVSIGQKLEMQGIKLPRVYAPDLEDQSKQVSAVNTAILQSLEPEDEILSTNQFAFFKAHFSDLSKLENLTEEQIEQKKNYIQQQYKLTVNASIAARQKDVDFYRAKFLHLEDLYSKLDNIETQLKRARTHYTNQTLGQMESLFHIYSGRLLQNYQSGLGVFIDTPNGKQRKTAAMNFTTVRDSEHDAALSMSSGQINALSLSLFLALNKKYAKTAFVFIDDPTQCMDEINIASLSDLLRVELRDRQVVISTHEQDISDYLCYRYGKAGLSRKQVNLLEKVKLSSN
ncbi:hypothetical protein ABT56_02535 [Photobacterium aquae]|uniref:RecF/RecN/SMC N-terminal domain-containing protein n=1 Tax=Photobacterium aquae TaxID=1195763 RepID=A0A0J1HBQ7_9GAMM|nr:AAA family ATPase [Photobacterium aquae]KLV09093.1 hypothetical protein ABT56_02535 [Photobacterium aquae]